MADAVRSAGCMEEQIMATLNCMNVYNNFQPNMITMHAYSDSWRVGSYSQNASSGELTREGTEGIVDSQDQSSIEVDDTFGLEFAALQWLNLVTNAEQLFNRLMNSILLTGDEKEQIQRWLCLKQECEECVASDEATSLGDHNRRSLERIEELTEDTEPTEQSSDSNKSSDSQYESETESDFDYHHPDFEDKLDGYMERFKDKTDELIRSKLLRDESSVIESVQGSRSCVLPFNQPSVSPIHLKGRRKSIHPGSVQITMPLIPSDDRKPECRDSAEEFSDISKTNPNMLALDLPFPSSVSLEPYKELKLLCSENGAKKTQIKQVLLDLEGAHKRMEELQHTIQIKEQFIKDIIKNSDTRACAKQRFQRKWSKLEEEYYKTRTQLAQAESALHETREEGMEDVSKHKIEVEKYKSLARHYEKRLKDIDMIKQIAGDSAKKVLELENSLQISRKQMEKLKKQLRKEEDHKHRLEQELIEDQQKMRALEEKYNLRVSKLIEERGDNVEGERLKWIAEETKRLNLQRESSQRLHVQLVQQQTILDKREAFLKEKVCQEKQRTKDIMEVSAKITHLENMLKEKSANDKSDEKDEKEALRQEIRNLRKTRDSLLDQRSDLDEKYQKEQTLSSTEERRYLECVEAIEAIDAAIEYKNELICGRKTMDCEKLKREEGEQLLMTRLMKLSPDEMRTLLYKYFQKVIDLREGGRKMELQLDESEQQNEVHMWRIQELSHALQTERLESERQMVAMQREHQEKLHLMLRHFAEESGSSGTEAGRHLVVAKDSEVSKMKRENKNLRRRLQELETLVQAHGVIRRRSRSVSPDTPTPLKQLPAPPSTTTVTRQKNKVIIQMNAPKKKQTNKHGMITFHHH